MHKTQKSGTWYYHRNSEKKIRKGEMRNGLEHGGERKKQKTCKRKKEKKSDGHTCTTN